MGETGGIRSTQLYTVRTFTRQPRFITNLRESGEIDPYDAIAYDIVWAYAHAADAHLADGNTLDASRLDGKLFGYLKSVNFSGITGQFFFSDKGDRGPRFEVVNFARGSKDESNERLEQKGIGTWTINSTGSSSLVIEEPIYWPSGSDKVPNFTPERKYWSCRQQRSGKTR